jgi:hypothetical protein
MVIEKLVHQVQVGGVRRRAKKIKVRAQLSIILVRQRAQVQRKQIVFIVRLIKSKRATEKSCLSGLRGAARDRQTQPQRERDSPKSFPSVTSIGPGLQNYVKRRILNCQNQEMAGEQSIVSLMCKPGRFSIRLCGWSPSTDSFEVTM